MPETLPISDKLINGTVAGQLAAALLAVSCVTVTFCVNLTMVQDRELAERLGEKARELGPSITASSIAEQWRQYMKKIVADRRNR